MGELGTISVNSLVVFASGCVVLLTLYEKVTNIFSKKKKKNNNRLVKLEKDVEDIKRSSDAHDCIIVDHKQELMVICKGTLACLKGLQEQGCNGPVTEGIKELEDHLLRSSH